MRTLHLFTIRYLFFFKVISQYGQLRRLLGNTLMAYRCWPNYWLPLVALQLNLHLLKYLVCSTICYVDKQKWFRLISAIYFALCPYSFDNDHFGDRHTFRIPSSFSPHFQTCTSHFFVIVAWHWRTQMKKKLTSELHFEIQSFLCLITFYYLLFFFFLF